MIEYAKYIYLFRKTSKNNWRRRKKTSSNLKSFKTQQLPIKKEFAEDQLSEEVKNEIENIKEIEKMVSTEKLIYKAGNLYIKFPTIWKIKIFC